jgi:hypothetical protein
VFLIPKESENFVEKVRQETADLQEEIRALLSKSLAVDHRNQLSDKNPSLPKASLRPGHGIMAGQLDDGKMENSGPDLVNSSSVKENVSFSSVPNGIPIRYFFAFRF